jgi:hypothetical protein
MECETKTGRLVLVGLSGVGREKLTDLTKNSGVLDGRRDVICLDYGEEEVAGDHCEFSFLVFVPWWWWSGCANAVCFLDPSHR